MKLTKKQFSLSEALPWLMTVGGLVGTLASIILVNDYVKLLKNPGFSPICNLNPIFSCTHVMASSQAHVFGFPNEYIGVAGYAALAAFGVALLAGAKFKHWLWRIINVGLLFAVGLVTWLQFETLERIGALCLFCMVVWLVTIPTFWYVSLYNFDNGHWPVPKKWKGIYTFIRKHHGDILLLWFLIIIAIILHRFWYYWKTVL